MTVKEFFWTLFAITGGIAIGVAFLWLVGAFNP